MVKYTVHELNECVLLQVSVQWEAAAVTAQTADFAPQGGTVQIPPDTSSAQLPLSIINDDDPEFSETLSVSLLAAGGGARLGNLLTTIVTIQSNDDPNGALGMSVHTSWEVPKNCVQWYIGNGFSLSPCPQK